jgi:hypothetical protein
VLGIVLQKGGMHEQILRCDDLFNEMFFSARESAFLHCSYAACTVNVPVESVILRVHIL